MRLSCQSIVLAAIALLITGASGCSMIARRLATADPGLAPRDGGVFRVTPVGSEQVRITFTFKVGKDPVMPQTASPLSSAPTPPPGDGGPEGPDVPPVVPPAPLPDRDESVVLHADIPVCVVAAAFIDRTGRSVEVVDYDVRRQSNVCYVSFTSGAVDPDSYEIICQAEVSAGSYQIMLASAVTRELNVWRADPRSLRFAVYGASERLPRWQFKLLGH